MHRLTTKSKFNINRFNFAIPLMAIAGLGTIGIFAINQDIDPNASASNSSTIKSTVSYDDQYITISNNSLIDLGNASVDADSSYVYATDNVTVSTNVDTGYELYLSSGSKDSAALTSTGNKYDTPIKATSGTGGDNGTPKVLDQDSYGYALTSSTIGNNNFDADYSSPTDNSKWAGIPAGSSDRIRSTNTASESGDTVAVHYAANLTNAIAPGEYTGQVVYSAVVTPDSGNVEMSVSPSSGMVDTTLTITSGPTTINTAANLDVSEVEVYFRQSGVTKGSCIVTNVSVASTGVTTTCTAPNLATGTYDVVVSIPRYGFKDMKASSYTSTTYIDYIMQDFTTSQCSTLKAFSSSDVSGTTYTFRDARDLNTYSVRKLADGHCWMVQDLNIVNKTISYTDSDFTSGTFTIPASTSGSGSWCKTSSTDCDDVAKVHVGTTSDTNWQEGYGPYYNWYTATAGSGKYSMSSGSVETSICPKGWKLPLGSTIEYSWYYLGQKYGFSGTTNNSTYASNFQTATNTGSGYWAGNYNNGSLTGAGSGGYWWSRTAYSNNNVYYLNTFSDIVNPQNGNYGAKFYGFSVRCVFVGS